jgi:hypothetical protein
MAHSIKTHKIVTKLLFIVFVIFPPIFLEKTVQFNTQNLSMSTIVALKISRSKTPQTQLFFLILIKKQPAQTDYF